MMTLAEKRSQWRARVADYLASGMTIREWCKKNGWRVDHLRYWLRKSDDTCQSPSWAFLDLINDESVASPSSLPGTPKSSSPTATDDTGISVRIGAAYINVQPGFDPSLLSEILRVVAATC